MTNRGGVGRCRRALRRAQDLGGAVNRGGVAGVGHRRGGRDQGQPMGDVHLGRLGRRRGPLSESTAIRKWSTTLVVGRPLRPVMG